MKPNVQEILPKQIPEGYRLGVDAWAFPEKKLEETLEDGTRKLLTLDMSISPKEFVENVNSGLKTELESRVNEFYGTICPNNCPGCFEKGNVTNYLLSWEDNKEIIDQAADLGLESIKFLGPGELITNPDLFTILDYLQQKNIKIGIFTKGETLGDDELAKKYHNMTSESLVKKMCGYDNTRVLIDCRTFDNEKANKMTHSTAKNYANARNHAIELLVQNGMNSDLYCQRMSLQTNPVTPETIDGVLEIFKWGAERNIPVCVTPTMVSGLGNKLVETSKQPEFQEKVIQLYTNIYSYLIDRGIMTLEQIKKEGISAYAGTSPCNQLSCGMFIRKDGIVQQCPGNDGEQFIIAKDVRKESLKDIWMNSANYKSGPRFNNHCVKDSYSIPAKLYKEVEKRLESKYQM